MKRQRSSGGALAAPPVAGNPKRPQRGALLSLVCLHSLQNAVEDPNGFGHVGALIEHHTLRALRHRCVGDLGARGHPVPGQALEHLRRPDDRGVSGLANPEDLLLHLGETLVADLEGEIAARDHDADGMSPGGLEQQPR